MSRSNLPKLGPATDNSIDQAKSRLLSCADAGLFRHAVDARYGGLGNSFMELAQIHEELGYQSRDPGLILAVNAHIWGAVFTIKRFGTEAQKEHWLPSLLDGQILGGHAITEPHAGSNVQSMTTTYRELDEGFILNGQKRYITNTPIAGVMVVYAKREQSGEISAFLVKSDDSGAEFTHKPTLKGCATASIGDIILSDCLLKKSRLLGKPGAGSTMIQLALELERSFIFAGITGVMKWQLEQVVDYVKRRESGSGKLGQHQAVSHTIAEMKLRLDTSQLWIWRCANLLDTGKRITVPSAQTKLYASEAFLQSTLDACHMLGAAGLTEEFTTLVNDAMAGTLMAGSSEIQRNIIAAMMGLPMDNRG